MSVQALLFERGKYNPVSASRWASAKGYSPIKYHVTPNFVRARIRTPQPGAKYWMDQLSPHVRVVRMAPVKARAKGGFVAYASKKYGKGTHKKPATKKGGGRGRFIPRASSYTGNGAKRSHVRRQRPRGLGRTHKGRGVFDFLVSNQRTVGSVLNVLEKVLPVLFYGGVGYAAYRGIKKLKEGSGVGVYTFRRPWGRLL